VRQVAAPEVVDGLNCASCKTRIWPGGEILPPKEVVPETWETKMFGQAYTGAEPSDMPKVHRHTPYHHWPPLPA
jgi:hypothetical protein